MGKYPNIGAKRCLRAFLCNALMQEYFRASSVKSEKNEAPDPVIHFYEDFLREYDAEQRKKWKVPPFLD